jgi:hypothetical protein
MGKPQLQCPNCQGTVTLGEVTCPHCGVNLKSGESYETQVKRARGKVKHKEMYTGGLYAGIVFAVSLCIFAGYMYQRAMTTVLTQRADLFKPRIEELQKAQDLADAGQYAEAKNAASHLVQELGQDADDIKPEIPFTADQVTTSYYTGQKAATWDKRGAKRLLLNLQAKAQYLLDDVTKRESAQAS